MPAFAKSSPAGNASGRPDNLLLRTLKEPDYQVLAPHLVSQHFERGTILFEPGDVISQIVFPCSGTMISLAAAMPDGLSVETALIGREGAVGGVISLGHQPAFTRGIVQSGGPAVRIAAKILNEARTLSVTCRNVFAGYADCLLAQVLQSVACNARHPVDQRCCGWLLLAQDRCASSELPFTHEFLSEMLGVQRSTITQVMLSLQERGILSYRRGRVKVLDREAMERSSCLCYSVVRKHFERVAPGLYPTP